MFSFCWTKFWAGRKVKTVKPWRGYYNQTMIDLYKSMYDNIFTDAEKKLIKINIINNVCDPIGPDDLKEKFSQAVLKRLKQK